ncbi:MAG: zinc ribbon domain-containing protein [Chloroflexi bacterium CFX4]|nr:zinc ribbon domain-containing protein [Chloroflexi bacterium CFX4]MDL1924467.1 zinc ribbon domain-containing protein [Chloroflexi bacterium CFX3]
MPLYVFICPECAIEIEERRSVEAVDDPLACPLCGMPCQRQMTFASFFTRRSEMPPPIENAPRRTHPANCVCCASPSKGSAI